MKSFKGKNRYKNNVFDSREWSAPYLYTMKAVLAKLRELKLEGRVIKNFYAVGMGYNWTDNDLGEAIYLALVKKVEAGELPTEGPYPYFPEAVSLIRWAELDEPFLIEFEDGDILCLDFPADGCVRMDMNSIPKDIHWGTNPRTFHPNVLFRSLLGMEIRWVEVTVMADENRKQGAELAKIALVCRGKSMETEKLEFTSAFDFCDVTVTDALGAPLRIPAAEARAVVEGFIPADILDSDNEYNVKNV